MWKFLISGYCCLAIKAFSLPNTATEDISYRAQLADLQGKIESSAAIFLRDLDIEASSRSSEMSKISWNYSTNITDENKKKKVDASLDYTDWANKTRRNVLLWKGLWPLLNDEYTRRQFELNSLPSTLELPKDELQKFFDLTSDMGSVYATAQVCRREGPCNLSLEPELTEIFRTSQNAQELKEMWLAWRFESGRKIREDYKTYVKLSNKGAMGHGYNDVGEMWRVSYESDTIKEDSALMFNEMKPLYQQLHAYVRRKLREVYGTSQISLRGPIPAHLLGNMWSQTWGNIYDLVVPYPGIPNFDVTENMKKQNYTARRMFEMADDFFLSLGMEGVSEKFWENSIIEKPEDRKIACHASAWDFSTTDDFRIKQCTRVTMDDLITAHHEMGHIQYYLQYKDLPVVFRQGANPGFHEAVGDVIALSVSTPQHLHQVGLLDVPERSKESDINYLMSIALEKIAFLPFAYTLETWRWGVFENETTLNTMNCDWWDKRFKNQGIMPPSTRSEDDFDPGAKNHVASNGKYIRYLYANILQFQFHRSLCLKAGKYDPNDPSKPLHLCDIYQSKEAGKAFGEMLRLGSSQPWPEVLEKVTGAKKMSSSALVEYFKPLEEWLKKDNEENNEFIGWEKDGVYCEAKPENVETRNDEKICNLIRTNEGVKCI